MQAPAAEKIQPYRPSLRACPAAPTGMLRGVVSSHPGRAIIGSLCRAGEAGQCRACLHPARGGFRDAAVSLPETAGQPSFVSARKRGEHRKRRPLVDHRQRPAASVRGPRQGNHHPRGWSKTRVYTAEDDVLAALEREMAAYKPVTHGALPLVFRRHGRLSFL